MTVNCPPVQLESVVCAKKTSKQQPKTTPKKSAANTFKSDSVISAVDMATAGLARRPTGYDQSRDEEPTAGGGGDDPHSARGVHTAGGHGLHGLSVSYSGFTRHRAVSIAPEP